MQFPLRSEALLDAQPELQRRIEMGLHLVSIAESTDDCTRAVRCARLADAIVSQVAQLPMPKPAIAQSSVILSRRLDCFKQRVGLAR
jgi:hypothetical protein